MRDIEFKARTIDDGRWVYGSYTCMEEDNKNNPFRQPPHKKYHRIWQYEPGDWNMGGYAGYEVIPATVCQFTGLKDKNREKIFEGDKFKYYEHDGFYLKSFTGYVKYESGSFGFEVIKDHLILYKSFSSFSRFDELQEDFLMHMEVVGSIYDKNQITMK